MNGHLTQVWQQKTFASFSGFCINNLSSAVLRRISRVVLNRSARVGRCRTPAFEPRVIGMVHWEVMSGFPAAAGSAPSR